MEGPPALLAQLARDGVAVVPLLAQDDLEPLRAGFAQLPAEVEGVRFFASHAALAPGPRRAVHELVMGVVAPALRALLPGARPVAGALLSKPSRNGAPLPFHQDLTYTDEREVRSFVCWTPLVDTGAQAGGLRVLRGSHRWTDLLRPGGPTEMATAPLQEQFDAVAETLEVPAGHAVIWDAALVHGSWGNPAAVPRPVATVAFLAADVPMTYFHRSRGGELEGFLVDDEWFFTGRPFVDRPEGYPAVAPWTRSVTADDLREHVDALVAAR